MTLIVPNQKFEHGKQVFEAGMKYDVPSAVAKKMLKEKKGKILKGSSPVIVKTAIPKISNRDPIKGND